jgi:hypothetical protein
VISEVCFFLIVPLTRQPQYLIKCDTTEHLAMHKGSALRKIAKGKIRSWV